MALLTLSGQPRLLNERELARLLTLYPVLHELPATLQHAFVDFAYPVHLPAGEVVFEAGRFVPSFFFLTSGSLRVSHLGNEREILLYRVQPGEVCILSVCHLLADVQYEAIAATEQAVAGVILPGTLFTRLVASSPLFCSYLFAAFSARLVDLLALLNAISFSRLDQRLARLLLSRGDTIRSTHSQLADELGTVREVISRILKAFEREDLVALERNKIRIVNRVALERIAASLGEARY